MITATRTEEENQDMVFPTFHLNGNNPDTLGHQYLEALMALQDFSEKFFKVDFHQRDYYVQSPENWEKAIAQRDIIKARMREIHHYLDKMTTHCFETKDKNSGWSWGGRTW